MIAGQPWRGWTSTRCIRRSASGVRGDAADAAAARAAGAPEAAAAGVLGDVRGRYAVAAGDARPGDVAAGVAAVVPEEGGGAGAAAVDRVVVAVAVLDDAVVLVDAVRRVVAAAGREGEREHGDGHERDVAGAAAGAFAHGTSSGVVSLWTRRRASTTSGCDTFARSLSNSSPSTASRCSISSSSSGVLSLSRMRGSRLSSARMPVRIATAPIPPAITKAATQRPANVSGEKSP